MIARGTTITSQGSTWNSNPLSSSFNSTSQVVNTTKRENPSKVSSSQKVKNLSLTLSTDRTTYTSGTEVSGILTITCTSSTRINLGDIWIEITGYEETLNPNDKTDTFQKNIYSEVVELQSLNLAPSDAVYPGNTDEHGTWKARKCSTVFKFCVKLPNEYCRNENQNCSLPSSFWNHRFGGIKYTVTAFVKTKVDNKLLSSPLHISKEFLVLEYAPSLQKYSFVETEHPSATDTRDVSTGFLFKSTGEIILTGKLHVPELSEGELGVWLAGGLGFIEIEIDNQSDKFLKTLKISLIRRLKTFKTIGNTNPQLIPINFSRLVVSKKKLKIQANNGSNWWSEKKKGKEENTLDWTGVGSREKKVLIVDLEIPLNARTIQNGSIIDVSFVVNITLPTRGKNSTSEVEIPIKILHPASLFDTLPKFSTSIIKPKIQEKEKFTEQETNQLADEFTFTNQINYLKEVQTNFQSKQPSRRASVYSQHSIYDGFDERRSVYSEYPQSNDYLINRVDDETASYSGNHIKRHSVYEGSVASSRNPITFTPPTEYKTSSLTLPSLRKSTTTQINLPHQTSSTRARPTSPATSIPNTSPPTQSIYDAPIILERRKTLPRQRKPPPPPPSPIKLERKQSVRGLCIDSVMSSMADTFIDDESVDNEGKKLTDEVGKAENHETESKFLERGLSEADESFFDDMNKMLASI